MTASIPPAAHEEIAFLDQIERELTELTTARLDEAEAPASRCARLLPQRFYATPALPLPLMNKAD